MADKIRVGVVGAGNFTNQRMLPGFQRIGDAELTVVANRSKESSQKVADQFEIPEIAADYREVIANPNVDAVFIGAPPYVHREVVLAALEAGKHVLLQTRMSTTAAEAREMYAKAEEVAKRGVRAMIVPPSPFGRGTKFIKHLIDSGYLGQLRHVMGFNLGSNMADSNTPLSAGRNEVSLYGQFNAGQLGLTYDAMSRWTGHATSLVAHRGWFVPERPTVPGGPMASGPYPEEASVLAETKSGAVALNVLNWSINFSESRIELYGEKGTVVYRQRGDVILGAQVGDEGLKELAIPAEHDNPWQAEAEFVRLIRGEIAEPSFTFLDGVRNMEYLEAAYYSATEGRRVELPA